ncbi:FadR/GntR family transcriptional regulator [Streptomyces sp. NPDC092296]|uniref:FadR/GntR family transcriptional regulator n=1 Tax=Streptomyces sp. NPDC092296 TaxID=3366012 RepID=UPI00382ADE34
MQRTSLVEQAVAELRRLIGEGEWPVGTKLPGEVELSQLLGVGRSTSREAVRALIADGQLHAHHGSGTFVASATPVSAFDRRLRRAAVADVYEVRVALEIEAGRLAAVRRTDEDVAAVQRAWEAREGATTPDAFVEADLALHRAVVTAAHNPVLDEVFATFLNALRGAATEIVGDDALQSREHQAAVDAAHRDLVAAVRDRDPEAAQDATRRNVELTLALLRGRGADHSAP